MACNFATSQAIVVGGGLAGMAAANTILEHGGRVVLLDKSAFCGGNSTKATSGINGANTKTQRAQGIKDSSELFLNDTLKGGAKKPEIAKVLCLNSADDVDWLVDIFSLDLSLLARLGGHSAPRTHRGKERFPGMTITYALIQMFEKVAEKSDIARIITKAHVKDLLTNGKGDIVGCEYTKGGQVFREMGPVIFATGGFGADFTSEGLLTKYRPDLSHLPTTNGEHCTGDGIKMAEAVGGKTIDLEWVQVHPTGLVNTQDPDAKVKFLAAEALRGVGGLLFDADGNRFANELGRRDYVTGEMWKSKAPFRLCLNKAASDEIIWHCKHYTGRNVMKHFESGQKLADEMGIPLQRLVEVHQAHYEAAKKQDADPEGGPFPAYPSGKSWDKASGDTGCGKKFYHNAIPGSQVATEPFYVAIVTPVIHYCMGGLEITTESEVVSDKTGKKINGLYAAGEVAGGVHGNNRLGGSSLLDCVVFGRVAGRAAAKYMLGNREKATSLKDLSGGGLSGTVEGSKSAGGSYEDNMNEAAGGATKAPVGSVAGPVAAATGGYTLGEVAKHNTKEDCWVVVNGQVLNVTSFLPDHPGGELAILTFAGKDATEEFNMIHPPDVITKYAADAIIGRLGTAGDAKAAVPAASGGLSAPLLDKPKAKRVQKAPDGEGQIGGYKGALFYMAWNFIAEILRTILCTGNVVLTNDRAGLTRSAIFLAFFIVIHAVGNLHIFLGPADFNGYGFFYVRLYWFKNINIQANIVEIYLLFCAMLHVMVGLKRTWDITANYTLKSGKLNLAISGVILLTYMVIHLFQFRFGATDPYKICVPPYLLNYDLTNLMHLRLFWLPCDSQPGLWEVPVRDIYKLEWELFQSGSWCIFYVIGAITFALHVCMGWEKLVPAPSFNIPRGQQSRVILMGKIVFWLLAVIYCSFPLYCYLSGPLNLSAYYKTEESNIITHQ
eukprot:GEMP01007309.1.p1 GENE.GEMP01007309.1~~GEMP01007309.1.p1  ORF type:complete len:967 (+),score=138.71 GEMP01007309.1:60-2903(+)